MDQEDTGHLKDALSILAIILIGIGFALTILKRARSWEIGILMLVAGIVVFYIRYYSDLLKGNERGQGIRIIEERK